MTSKQCAEDLAKRLNLPLNGTAIWHKRYYPKAKARAWTLDLGWITIPFADYPFFERAERGGHLATDLDGIASINKSYRRVCERIASWKPL